LEKRARVAESDQEVENKNSKEEAPAKSVNDLEIIGYFSILKGLFENIMTIVGGVLSETISIQTSYLILSLYPILVLVYLFFFFREEKVSRTSNLGLTILVFAEVGCMGECQKRKQRTPEVVLETGIRLTLALLLFERNFPTKLLRFHVVHPR
jgi:hypothetical protein